jgi:hypothetical protein
MNSQDAWAKEWKNAYAFFNSKGNVQTRSRLKTKWNKEFIEMLKYFYEKGKELKQ